MSTSTRTFVVSNVPRAIEPLPEVQYHLAVGQLLGRPLTRRKHRLQEEHNQLAHWDSGGQFDDRELIDQNVRQLSAVKAEEAAALRPIEACSRCYGRLVANVQTHPVMVAIHRAFAQHRPLCLSPDMIWLLITQGVAHHVNVHAERLRSQFVQHEGQLQIEVLRDDFRKGSPENPWGGVIDEMSLKIQEHIGGAVELFVPRFSTTTQAERIAAEIVLLDAMQSYFEYSISTYCGIPTVTLEGTVEDWEALADRAEAFAQFDLEWWLKPLRPILQEFIAAARGDVRRDFWQSIYKYAEISGGAAVTGWIAAFFPYFKDEQGKATIVNPWLAEGNEWLKMLLAGEWHENWFRPHGPTRVDCDRLMGGERPQHHIQLEGPSPADFPCGLSRAPFVWNYYTERFHMEFLGGFVGIAQDPDTLTLRPEIGWAIRESGNVV